MFLSFEKFINEGLASYKADLDAWRSPLDDIAYVPKYLNDSAIKFLAKNVGSKKSCNIISDGSDDQNLAGEIKDMLVNRHNGLFRNKKVGVILDNTNGEDLSVLLEFDVLIISAFTIAHGARAYEAFAKKHPELTFIFITDFVEDNEYYKSLPTFN